MIRFNSPEQVERWVKQNGVTQLRELSQRAALDPISAQFARNWLQRLDALMRIVDRNAPERDERRDDGARRSARVGTSAWFGFAAVAFALVTLGTGI